MRAREMVLIACLVTWAGLAQAAAVAVGAHNATLSVAPVQSTRTYHVDAVRGEDNNNGLSPKAAFATIQKGIGAATDGDTVIVAPGTYCENISLKGKNITLRSTDPSDPDVVGSTVIDGQQVSSVVTVDSGESADCVLSGLTITNGKSDYGGGVYVDGASPTLTDCIIRGSSADEGGGIYSKNGSHITLANCQIIQNSAGLGGGMYSCPRCSSTLTNCTFTGNTAAMCAGMMNNGSDATLTGCVFTNNSATGTAGGMFNSNSETMLIGCFFEGNAASWGGAICCEPSNSLIVTNCRITGNSAQFGGGMYSAPNRITISNSYISKNSAQQGGGIWSDGAVITVKNSVISENTATERGGAVFLWGATEGLLTASNCTLVKNTSPEGKAIFCSEWAGECSVTNSILYDGGKEIVLSDATALDVTYSVVQGGWPGTGNIDADPRLAADGYHLAPGSPCINAGDAAADYAGQTDIDGEPRVIAGRVDIGADEFYLEEGPAVYYVDVKNGSDTFNGLSHETAFATVQRGIDSARDGDTVLVYSGVYAERILFSGKAVTVQSADDAAILEGLGEFAVSFYKGEGPDTILRNFVIRGCIVGVCVVDSSPTISNVTVVDNEFGIAAYKGAEPNITNSIFWNNSNSDLFECQARYSWVQRDVSPVLMDGLVSYWPFDETGDNIAHDVAGGQDGVVHGAQWVHGVVGGALQFDGVDDYVELPANEPVWLPREDFTLSVWIYFERDSVSSSSENEVIIDLNFGDSSDPANELGCMINRRSGSAQLCFKITTTTNSDEDLCSNEILAANTWHHIVAVREGTSQTIYLNGRLDKSRTCSADPIDFVGGYDDNKVNVGRYTTTIGQPRYYLQGGIDDVRIYDRALSAEEIQQLYQIGLDGSGFGTNPLFADPANGDYHLLSERGRYWPEHDVWVLDKVTSPCIDGGDPNADYSNEPTPNGGRINMGAYGGTPYASMSETQWFDPDVNQDGIIDLTDLIALMEDWLELTGWFL